MNIFCLCCGYIGVWESFEIFLLHSIFSSDYLSLLYNYAWNPIVFERNKPSIIKNIKESYGCDICGTKCKRGRTRGGIKYGMNECSIQKLVEDTK